MASPLPSSTALKNAVRRRLRATLPDAGTAALESAAIRHGLLGWLLGFSQRTIAAFSPLPGEVDLMPLLAETPGLRWVLPRVEGYGLVFHEVAHPGELLSGAFGIAEPGPDLPVIPPQEIDVFLCPGLGFTRSGVRMGRGKGFYDRTLETARADALRVGITFRSQVLEEIPTEPHDLPMHFLATEDGVQASIADASSLPDGK